MTQSAADLPTAPSFAAPSRRAVLVVCDGLRADMVTPEHAPHLTALAGRGRWFAAHRGVFPSVTRVTSASIATGCLPGTHGLHGNTMALDEGAGLVCRNAGDPDFRDRLRRATGQTLCVPTLAERLAPHGGAAVYSNVSPGAAYFQDPDSFGHVFHRDGSFGPGGTLLPRERWPSIAKGPAGDRALTEQFCRESLAPGGPPLAVLWLSEPDDTGHHGALGRPEHLAAIAAADTCVGMVVDELASGGDAEWLLIVCSDHGHVMVDHSVEVDAELVAAGLKAGLDSTDVVVAPQGTSALVYLADEAARAAERVRDFLAGQPWAERVYGRDELAGIGLAPRHGLALAVDMKKSERVNEFGIAGTSLAAMNSDGGKDYMGMGQHGGFGTAEQAPFMIALGGGTASGSREERPTSPIQIAPTILRHLGQPHDGLDGAPLALH